MIAYARDGGHPLAWESYVEGQLAARIRFLAGPQGSRRGDRRAVQENAAGHELARWEQVESSVLVDAIPELTDGWSGYVSLDRRADRPAIDVPLADALTAMREFEWAKASEQLGLLSDERARHPLVRLLQAWCLENDPRIGMHDRLVSQLCEVAQSDAPDLLRFVADGNFPSLTASERYAILSLQPESTQTAEDCDRLSEAAIAAGKQQEALRYAEAALTRGGKDAHESQRRQRRAGLLLRLERSQEAVADVLEWAAEAKRAPLELSAMAELLAGHAQNAPAEQLFTRALESETLADDERYAFLRRWAAARQGVARCEKLLEAAAIKPSGSPERLECVDRIRNELRNSANAGAAGQLARKTADGQLSAELLVLQSELTPDAGLAAEILWKLYRAGQLDDVRLGWACQIWNRAEHPQRVIEACETPLRAGRHLPVAALAQLAIAYSAEHRDVDARRAASRDAEPAVVLPAATGAVPPRPAGGFF